MEEREFEGYWWTPEEPERRVPGRLRYSPTEGARLELLGSLSNPADFGRVGANRLAVVFGATRHDDVTIFGALQTATTLLVDPLYAREAFVSSLLLVGAHIPVLGELDISACQVKFSQLDEWLDLGGFGVELVDPAHADDVDDFLFRVTYRRVSLPSVTARDMQFAFEFESSVPLNFKRALDLRESSRLDITPVKPQRFDQFDREVLWPLQNLITFAVDRPNVLTSLRVKVGDQRWADILRSDRTDELTPRGLALLLFAYSHVKERLSNFLDAWFVLYERLGPALNAMFSVIYNDVRPTDTKFLNIAQAAESYHRRLNPVPDEMLQDHKGKVDRILSAVSPDDRNWLSGKLAHSGEPFFTERLTALFERLGEDFLKPMFPTKKKLESGVWRIADWRNKLTHMRAEPSEISAGLREIFVCTNQLFICLKANLRLDLGFDQKHLADAFRFNQTYLVFSRKDAPL
jgi:hypothetical protein